MRESWLYYFICGHIIRRQVTMTDKQIIIDYENLCANYSKEVGCYNTFDGNCIKEQCFTYRLLQLLKAKEQECEELKEELQAQRDFTAHEQKLIYCVAYDETCKTGNDCKQEKCVFKVNIKLKQALAEIKEIAEWHTTSADSEDVQEDMKQILQKISECEVE